MCLDRLSRCEVAARRPARARGGGLFRRRVAVGLRARGVQPCANGTSKTMSTVVGAAYDWLEDRLEDSLERAVGTWADWVRHSLLLKICLCITACVGSYYFY